MPLYEKVAGRFGGQDFECYGTKVREGRVFRTKDPWPFPIGPEWKPFYPPSRFDDNRLQTICEEKSGGPGKTSGTSSGRTRPVSDRLPWFPSIYIIDSIIRNVTNYIYRGSRQSAKGKRCEESTIGIDGYSS